MSCSFLTLENESLLDEEKQSRELGETGSRELWLLNLLGGVSAAILFRRRIGQKYGTSSMNPNP